MRINSRSETDSVRFFKDLDSSRSSDEYIIGVSKIRNSLVKGITIVTHDNFVEIDTEDGYTHLFQGIPYRFRFRKGGD